jgi:hypothetical protein
MIHLDGFPGEGAASHPFARPVTHDVLAGALMNREDQRPAWLNGLCEIMSAMRR